MATVPAPIPTPADALPPTPAGGIHALWRERTALLLESTGQALFGVDLDGRCVFINRAATEQLGWTAEEALQRNMHALIHHTHADGRPYPEADCPIFQAFRQQRPCRIDDEVLWRKDGRSFPAEYSSYPVVEATPDGPVRLGAIVTFVDISQRREAEAQLRALNVELERRVAERTRDTREALARVRELAAHLEAVREDERSRIAREIHDELGSLLVALKLDTGWLGKRVADRPELRCKCHAMGRTIDQAVDSLGRIITDLRPSLLDHTGLWAALEWQAQEFADRMAGDGTVVDVAVHVAADVPPPEGGVATAVFRMFQELLSNVARHARARHVAIRLEVDGPPAATLHLAVADDGVGLDPVAVDASRRHGLRGLRERAAHFGGRVTVDGAPGAGTRVRLAMPLPEPAGADADLDAGIDPAAGAADAAAPPGHGSAAP